MVTIVNPYHILGFQGKEHTYTCGIIFRGAIS